MNADRQALPDELVQAAAEAIAAKMNKTADGFEPTRPDECMGEATVALRAAFAKLPECEAAVGAVATALTRRRRDGTVPRSADDLSRVALAALAREFGDAT